MSSDVRSMLKAANRSVDNSLEIEHKYDQSSFADIKADPTFINKGEVEWNKARAKWSHQFRDQPPEDIEDVEEWLEDVDHIISGMRSYKPFAEPVPLVLMAELLEVIWIEAPNV